MASPTQTPAALKKAREAAARAKRQADLVAQMKNNSPEELRKMAKDIVMNGEGVSPAQALVAKSMAVPNPTYARADFTRDWSKTFTVLHLPLEQVCEYEKNPRKLPHEKYQQLKEAIKNELTDPAKADKRMDVLAITQRPQDKAENKYVLAFGGNTRLKILKELQAELRLEKLQGLLEWNFRPYEGEEKLLVAHLAENEHRAELTFWDKATSYIELGQEIAKQQGVEKLSSRELEAALKARGFTEGVGHAAVQVYQFAVSYLSTLGESVGLLQFYPIQNHIKPEYLRLQAVASRFGKEDEFGEAAKEAMAAFNRRFLDHEELDIKALVPMWYEVLSKLIDIPADKIPALIETMKAFPDMEADLLRQTVLQPAPKPVVATAVVAVANEQGEAVDTTLPLPLDGENAGDSGFGGGADSDEFDESEEGDNGDSLNGQEAYALPPMSSSLPAEYQGLSQKEKLALLQKNMQAAGGGAVSDETYPGHVSDTQHEEALARSVLPAALPDTPTPQLSDKQQFMVALQELAQEVGIDKLVQYDEDLPYGFFADPPRIEDLPALGELTPIWWAFVLFMSKQQTNAQVFNLLPNESLFKQYRLSNNPPQELIQAGWYTLHPQNRTTYIASGLSRGGQLLMNLFASQPQLIVKVAQLAEIHGRITVAIGAAV